MPIGQATYIETITVDPVYTLVTAPAISSGTPWQNPDNPLDVNADGMVNGQDALFISNKIVADGAGPLPVPPLYGKGPPPYYDVDGNNAVNVEDFNTIVNYLNSLGEVGLEPKPNTVEARTYKRITDFKIQRDLLDPSRFTRASQLVATKGKVVRNYTAYFRNFENKSLTEITMSTAVKTKDSVVFVHNALLTDPNPISSGCSQSSPALVRIAARIGRREILPTRYLWPHG